MNTCKSRKWSNLANDFKGLFVDGFDKYFVPSIFLVPTYESRKGKCEHIEVETDLHRSFSEFHLPEQKTTEYSASEEHNDYHQLQECNAFVDDLRQTNKHGIVRAQSNNLKHSEN